jgi:transaldolase
MTRKKFSLVFSDSTARKTTSPPKKITVRLSDLKYQSIQKAKKTSSTQQAVENQSFRQQQKRKLPITAGIITCPPELIKTVRQKKISDQNKLKNDHSPREDYRKT